MREVTKRGGPSHGYQSEVEHGKKTEVPPELLQPWIRILGVTDAFVRGEVPRYLADPSACRGLAADIAVMVYKGRDDLPDWVGMTLQQRARAVTQLIADHSRNLPRLVLAYVLSLEVRTLEAILKGDVLMVRQQVEALSDLTTLPQEFFEHGILEAPDGDAAVERFLPAVRLAHTMGLTLDDLMACITEKACMPSKSATAPLMKLN